ncbi:signal peptide peptidase SppA [Blochmannia endosymbiont of Camponotus (Colobopsis) obliquus]|uniref:signal peptide peptidase SppA n=1 Tax=Blochmannia endosymbiont of Camponotus (Colobopsis) obliquus TaxID=1505597 RepID=UPI00061A5A87|nr:signal peptide peptidase SppA [Blochmannia endosymbiont of Camponotus (Colobopsis) obliquus]AKC60591.1 protease 4 [Blochmannia endosymbiont of Camponotus (Colobopsis) obliquus]
MQKFWKIVYVVFAQCWNILKIIREFIMNLILLLIIISIIGLYLFVHRTNTISNSIKNAALIVDITGTIVDKVTINNKLSRLSKELINTPKNKLQENSLFDFIALLRQAKNDPNITGLILSLKNFTGTDQPSLQYIGKVLNEFRDTGKIIYAISDHYSQAQYFLASYANKIYLAPHGAIDIHGISTNNFYYKSLLDKLKINTYIFRIGTYKSAVEPFLRDNMSDEAKYMEKYWIEKLWQNYLNIIATNRQITKQQLFPNIKILLNDLQNLHGDTAQYALKNKLIDEIISKSMFEKIMIKKFGLNKKNNSFNSISIYDYQLLPTKEIKNKIAVIFVNGTVIDGSDAPGMVSSDTIISYIRDARINDDIKAIIFRINSPGGSVNAAEAISSELLLTKKTGKPIIVSMGGMAASGGYWISTPASTIIAHDNTLTGSIGIFGIINTFEKSLDSIGIHTDGVSTSPLANISISKELPHEYIKMMHIYIKKGYENFIHTIANFRNKSPQEIDQIAQGRIWIGTDALQKGLIDNLGDFDDAVNKAIELANIKEYQLTWYLEEVNLIDMLLTQINGLCNKTISSALKFNNIIDKNQLIYQLIDFKIKENDPHNCYAITLSSYCI